MCVVVVCISSSVDDKMFDCCTLSPGVHNTKKTYTQSDLQGGSTYIAAHCVLKLTKHGTAVDRDRFWCTWSPSTSYNAAYAVYTSAQPLISHTAVVLLTVPEISETLTSCCMHIVPFVYLFVLSSVLWSTGSKTKRKTKEDLERGCQRGLSST